jgi:hypothetical protein
VFFPAAALALAVWSAAEAVAGIGILRGKRSR